MNEPTEIYQELHADQANVEHVEHASMPLNIHADCAVASLFGTPCASSTHEAAIAIDQPDIHFHIDLEPVAVGLSILGICIAMAATVIARKL